MDNDFGEQILADKLSKLNNTQQSIEALSHWCIFHRQKAELVVRTWDKQFHGAREEQRVPFLYLANDIIQNSRRKGNEFVGEFWKILPAALKEVAESGDDRAKSVVSRLVKIWEERKVFGSRAGDLKDFMLGDEPPPALDLSLKRSRSVRIIKRDSRSVKLKLSVGGAAEKIVSAYHAVMSDRQKEDDELRECQAAVNRVGKMEKDVDHACAQEGVGPRTALAEELEEQQSVLKECVEKLVPLEKKRAALVHQLREALLEQESELENVRTQMQVARAQIDEAAGMRRRLNNEPPVPRAAPLPPRKSAAAIAAEIADKLTASSRSQQIMTSVLSSFAAEEAKNATLSSAAAAAPPISEGRAIGGAAAHLHHAVVPPPPQYGGFSAPRQYSVQPSGAAMLIGVPYTYGGLPPPLPPPSVQGVNLARPQLTQPPPPPPQQQGIATMQNPTPPPPPPRPIAMPPPSYRPVQSSGMAFYQHRSQ